MVRVTRMVRKKLGELLVSEGLINQNQVQEALDIQKDKGGLFGDILVELGYIKETDIVRLLSAQFSLPYIEVPQYAVSKDVIRRVSVEVAKKNQVFPLDAIGKTLIVAVSGLINMELLQELEQTTGCSVQLYVTTPTQVREAIAKHYG